MKKYTVSSVRKRFSQALDEAARGEAVFIERKGVTYRLSVDKPKKAARPSKPIFDIVDPAIESGQWTWDWNAGNLEFRSPSDASDRKTR
jgi:hypothetical protein